VISAERSESEGPAAKRYMFVDPAAKRYMFVDPAAKRRKNVATAEGRGHEFNLRKSRGAAKESSSATRLMALTITNHGLQPWLHSYAAPRLNHAAHF